MILYNPDMANTKSAKKNIRASARKKSHNDMWEKRIKTAKKSLSRSILSNEDKQVVLEKMVVLQKSLDKAVKEKTIHKNKANRVKSRYAKKISAQILGGSGETNEGGPKSNSKSGKKPKAKSK